jgi:hypothetical protein
MIPAFLTSLADLVERLVAERKVLPCRLNPKRITEASGRTKAFLQMLSRIKTYRRELEAMR